MKKAFIVLILLLLTSCTSIISGLQNLVKPEPDININNNSITTETLTEVSVKNGEFYNFNDNLKANGPMTTESLPSLGAPKLLVIPVTFPNSSTTDLERERIVNDLKIAFNGTQEETGYYSLNEFYQISSYGKLNLTADVMDFYTASNNSIYYKNYEKKHNTIGSDILLEEILNFYDPIIDFTEYDYPELQPNGSRKGDGYIDGIWIVYDVPVDFANGDFWWAYQTSLHLIQKFDGKKVANYAFAGADFMYDKKHNSYDARNIKVDAHTFIHETGHMMGLDDYYSYNNTHEGDAYGTYGYDMMDQTHGDHNALSKLLLGWINPRIITNDIEIDLNSFAKTGEALLVTDSFHGTIYDHYYLITCYDEALINLKDKPIPSSSPFYNDGIVIYECHAEKPAIEKYYGDSYVTGFAYNNSDNKIYNILTGFNYDLSEWFVRFLTNGPESPSNKNVLFQKGDTLNKNLFFDFLVKSRNLDKLNFSSYTLTITFTKSA